MKPAKTTSIIGKNAQFDGELVLKGGVRIDGKFSGTLQCDSAIYLGETADVHATIRAESLISSGHVEGDLKTTRHVQFNLPGSFKGSVETRELVLEKGVFFHGPCKMTDGTD